MWCLIENKRILFFDGQKLKIADKLKEQLSHFTLDNISEEDEELQIKIKRDKIKMLGKKLIYLYNSYDGILQFNCQNCKFESYISWV